VTSWLHEAPLYQAWRRAVAVETSFTIPGHKRRAHDLAPELGRLFDADVPLYGGLDTVKLDTDVVGQAERLGARLWAADWCRYSTGGSTHANQAVALAVGQPGDEVLVARNAHRSTLTGLVLAGLEPVWLPSSVDEGRGVPTGLDLGALDAALAAHPRARAVFAVEPGYLGTVSDLPEVVRRAHEAGLPVVVDQAWGAHFGRAEGYPLDALALGADAMVLSAHKTLPAWTQGSVLAARTARLDPDRLERGFEAAFTTSPSGAILASIDVARALLASATGTDRLHRLAALVAEVRAALNGVGVDTLDPESFPSGRFDPAKLVLLLGPSGHDGIALERHLLADGIPVEMADRDTVVPIVTMMDTPDSVAALQVSLLDGLREQGRTVPRTVGVAAPWRDAAPRAMSPRAAFFAPHERVRAEDAVGRVSAELVAPYPPGIPVVVPGEVLTDATVAALRESQRAGVRIAYAADPTLRSFQVVSRTRRGRAGPGPASP
jgi:arginine decarboxylase